MHERMRCGRDEDGSALPLIIFFGALSVLLVLIVAAATSLYLEKKQLFTLADASALVGAEAFDLEDVTIGDDGPRVRLDPARVRADVSEYLDNEPTGAFDALTLEDATSFDGRSATVTVSATWHPPVVALFLPEGMRINATASARSVFG